MNKIDGLNRSGQCCVAVGYRAWWNILWFALFGVGMGIYLIAMPKQCDDFWYMLPLGEWFGRQGVYNPDEGGDILSYGIPWSELREIWSAHYYWDNPRLCNWLVTFFLLLPKWVGSSIMLALLLSTANMLFRLLRIEWLHSLFTVPVLACLTLTLPWIDSMGSVVYQFNYVLPGWLAMLTTLFIFIRMEGRKRIRKRDYVYGSLLGLFLGVMHEGFLLPVLASLSVMVVLRKRWRCAFVFTCIASIAVGFIIMMQSPSLTARIGGQAVGRGLPSLGEITSVIFKSCWLLMGAICLWCHILFVRKSVIARKRVLNSDILLYAFSGSVVTILISLFAHAGLRMSYWLELMSVAMLVVLLRAEKGWIRLKAGRIVQRVYLILCVSMLFGLTFWSYYAISFHRLWNKALDGFHSHPELYIFSESPLPGALEDLSTFTYRIYSCILLNRFYGFPNKDMLSTAFLPYDFKQADGKSGKVIDKKNNIRQIGSYFYMPVPESWCEGGYNEIPPIRFYVEYPGGKGVRNVAAIPFRSDADGKKYVWLYPQLPWNFYNSSRVTRMWPLDDSFK